jgi:UDP-N-acetylglucosamine 1-carboxyvinyltransferase
MDKFRIRGGARLEGELPVSGAKNSALPALAACLLTSEKVILRRIPQVRDIRTMEKLLNYTGAAVQDEAGTVTVQADGIKNAEAPYEIVKTMRASSLAMGPLLGRCGRARVSMPGGCAIGARPINLHVSALEQLGAQVEQTHGYFEATAPNGLRGGEIHFDRITVTGTEDVMMAAVLARGETVIRNAAREPEVTDLAALLTKMGARIEGAGTPIITIEGVDRLHGAEHTIIADRIEAGTFLQAGALTRGKVLVTGCLPDQWGPLVDQMRLAGAEITEESATSLRVRCSRRPKAVDIATEEYPGFATDLQAQYMAWMAVAEGISFVTETIFENRFMHAPELARMGANIRIEGRQAIVAGERYLTGAQVMGSDLRASAALVLAAMVAEGDSYIERVYHMDRGYEKLEQKLNAAGAGIERVVQ